MSKMKQTLSNESNDIYIRDYGEEEYNDEYYDDDQIYCRCGNNDAKIRLDAYGIPTGHWCDKCYYSDNGNYPYRRDRYDYIGMGERLEEEDY